MHRSFRTLYCYGPPGIGKTVLASVIVDHLHASLHPECRVLGFFCESSGTVKDKYRALLGSLLQQLTANQCSTWDDIEKLYDQHRHGTSPNPKELLHILQMEIQQTQRTYIVLDSLDEWSPHA